MMACDSNLSAEGGGLKQEDFCKLGNSRGYTVSSSPRLHRKTNV